MVIDLFCDIKVSGQLIVVAVVGGSREEQHSQFTEGLEDLHIFTVRLVLDLIGHPSWLAKPMREVDCCIRSQWERYPGLDRQTKMNLTNINPN